MIGRKLLIAVVITTSVVVSACSDMTAPKSAVPGSLSAAAILAPKRGESQSETFDFTTIDVPGALSTSAGGINARGEIVGSYVDANHHSHGYLLRGGEFTTIDFPGSAFTEAWGVGPDGEVVGDYRFAGEPTVNLHGYLRTKDGDFVPVNDPPHTNTVVQRILPDGTMLGCRHDTDQMSTMRGLVFSKNGSIAELDKFGSMNTGGTPDGQRIVGFYTDMGTNRVEGFLIDSGQFTPLFVPGSTITRAFDINPAGAIVGVYVSAGVFRGFVLTDGSYVSIEVPGATATRAWGINARGDIVGVYAVSGGMTHGFLTRLTRNN